VLRRRTEIGCAVKPGEKGGFMISLSDIDLLPWGLLRSRKNRGISLP